MNIMSIKLANSNNIKRTLFISLVLGIIIGLFLVFSPGTLFVVILAAICCFLILKYLPASERKFVKRVFIVGLILRMTIAVTLDITAFAFFEDAIMKNVTRRDGSGLEYLFPMEKTRIFLKMGDSDWYSLRGYAYSAWAKGINGHIIRDLLFGPRSQYAWSRHQYIIGLFYYLFDYSPIAIKFLNCLIGMLGAVFIYKIGLYFSNKIARISFLILAFFPTLVLWSTTNLKEPMLILISAAGIWSFITFIQARKAKYLILTLSIIFICFLFAHIAIWLIFSLSLALTAFSILSLHKKILLIFIIAIILMIIPKHVNLRAFSIRNVFENICIRHIGHVGTEGISYKFLDEKYYKNPNLLLDMKIGEFAILTIKSIIHFLFEPFPKYIKYPQFLLFYIQTAVWYFLVFFSLIGFFRCSIYGHKFFFPLLFYVIIGTFVLALASGNIGTLIRQRDILTPFYFIFSAIGIGYLFKFE